MSRLAFLTSLPLHSHPLHARPRPRPRPLPHITPKPLRHPITPKASLPPQPRHSSRLTAIFTRAIADTNLLLTQSKNILTTFALITLLTLPVSTHAAQRGGRIGGSSFRAPRPSPSRSYTPRSSPAPAYPSYSPFMSPGVYISPFIMPGGFGLGGFGLGGFGTLFLFATAATFLLQSLKSTSVESQIENVQNPVTAVAVVKVALLANARQLQVTLDNLARTADTTTIKGLRYVLSETATSLLRNPDYWTHASVSITAPRLRNAETAFEEAALKERLKLDEETLSNTRGITNESMRASQEKDLTNVPGEYIVVSIVTAASGALVTRLPKLVDGVPDVTRALSALAAVASDDLQAVEIVWAPQSLRDVLTETELLQDHPELRRL